MRDKIIVLGLDGATFEFIIPLMRKGVLKTFKTLLNYSIVAPLRSTIPPITIPAWQSMFSGLSPEKLGITDFFKIVDNKLVPITSKDIRGKMLWDVYKDLRFIIYNIPGTYPAYKVNGIMISTPIGTWNPKSIYPPEKKSEIEKIFTKKMLNTFRDIPITKRGRVKQLYSLTKAETELFRYLYTNYEFDIFIFRYEITDYIAHWAKDREEIEKAYIFLDRELEKLFNGIDLENTYILIVSDHGVSPEPKEKKFFINSWLLKQGYLNLNSDVGQKSRLNNLLEGIGKFLITHNILDKVTLVKLYTKILKMFKKGQRSFTQSFIDQIDIKKSKAYAYTSAGGIICIRMEDTSIIEELSNKLLRIKDDEGIPPIVNVVRRTFVEKPEIIAESHPKYSLHHEIVRELFLKNIKSFSHSSEGIFMVYPVTRFNANEMGNIDETKRYKVEVFDVMPTISYLLNLPIPLGISGRVPLELFRKHREFANRDIRYLHKESIILPPNEAERMRKIVKNLVMRGEI